MTLKTELVQLMPGLFIALVLFSASLLPAFLNNVLPKYYGGDPNYSLEKYEKLRKESTERFRQNFPEFSEENLLFELPPKMIDKRIWFIYLLIIPFQVIWGLYWSVYAYLKRDSFRSKNIVWITYAIYLVELFAGFHLVGEGMKNFG